jgi:hypothetical protein
VAIARNAPLDEAGWQQEIMFFGKTKVIYFSRRDWTGQIKLIVLAKFAGARDQARRSNRRGCIHHSPMSPLACTFTHD